MYCTAILFLFFIYLYGIRSFQYWKKKGVKHDRPVPYFGNNLKQFFILSSISNTASEIYKKYPEEKVVGFYRGTHPELIIRDPEIIKRILVTDFYNFYDRVAAFNGGVTDHLMKNLFHASGDGWHLIRQKISPAFSTAKIKAVFPIICQKTVKLQVAAEKESENKLCNVKELMSKYYLETIGETGFGINMDCLNDDNALFRKLANRILERTFRDGVVIATKLFFPWVGNKIKLFAPEIEQMTESLVNHVMKQKNYKPSGRNDFIDYLLGIREKIKAVIGESIENKQAATSDCTNLVEIPFDNWVMIAQVFVYFAASFETSSTVSSFTLHQMAFNPDCMQKAQQEIDRVLSKNNNQITYDSIKEMTYLHMAVCEALRMFPPIGHLTRVCTSNTYKVPNLNVILKKGDAIMIPIQAILMDEKYFKNPKQFFPERFDKTNNTSQNVAYIPFGEGPRKCVGMRLGIMQAMVGVVAILQKFTVHPAPCSVRQPALDPTGFIAEKFLGGLPLKLKKRSK